MMNPSSRAVNTTRIGELNSVSLLTNLVQNLSAKLNANREAGEKVNAAAERVITTEKLKLQILTDNLSDEQLDLLELDGVEPENGGKQEPEEVENLQESIEEKEARLEKENLNLKIHLQRLGVVDSKTSELIQRYETTISNVKEEAKNYARGFVAATKVLKESYEARMVEEQCRYEDLEDQHKNLLRKLVPVRDALKDVNEKVDSGISTSLKYRKNEVIR